MSNEQWHVWEGTLEPARRPRCLRSQSVYRRVRKHDYKIGKYVLHAFVFTDRSRKFKPVETILPAYFELEE